MSENDELYRIYRNLTAYLIEEPPKSAYQWHLATDFHQPFNRAVLRIIEILQDESYSEYKYIEPIQGAFKVAVWRQKTLALLARLNNEHFPDKHDPLARTEDSPTAVFSQSQAQSQDVIVNIALDLQKLFNEKLSNDNLGEEQRTFLEKAKDGLLGVKSIIQIINLIITTAQDAGLDLPQLGDLLTR